MVVYVRTYQDKLAGCCRAFDFSGERPELICRTIDHWDARPGQCRQDVIFGV